jgi:hypothetical protein
LDRAVCSLREATGTETAKKGCSAMPLCSRPNEQIRNILDLAKRLGVLADSESAGDLDLISAVRICSDCSCGEACRDWLASAPRKLKQPPSFCPDALRLARAKAALV